MSELPVLFALAIGCPVGFFALWLWGPGQPWWRSLPRVDRFRWVMYAQLGLLAASIPMTIAWWPAGVLAALMFFAIRVTVRELNLEIESERLERLLDDLEESGKVPVQVVQALRRSLDSLQ